jgi:predicted dehydrogenase
MFSSHATQKDTENMAEKLRFGIVGCGVIGPVHAEAIASLPDAQLVSVVDLNPEKAQKLASQYGATPYTSTTNAGSRASGCRYL